MGSAPRLTVFLHEYVTGGGLAGAPLPASWAAEGSAMRLALAEDFSALPGVRVLATLDARLTPRRGPWADLLVHPGEELATFARLSAEADWTALIAPETAGILAERARLIERCGGRSLGSTPAAIALAGCKWATFQHLRRLGVATPPTRRIHPGSASRRTIIRHHPAVIKPLDGAGSVDTYLIASPDSPIPPGVGRMAVALLQPYLPGTPMSASFLVDARGRAHPVGVAAQRIALRDGRFSYLGGTVPGADGEPPAAVRRAVDSMPGLRGWVGVDFLRDEADGSATVLEINPRLTTSYVGLRALLPAGELAASWLHALDGSPDGRMDRWASRLHARRPVTFTADGTIFALDGDDVVR